MKHKFVQFLCLAMCALALTALTACGTNLADGAKIYDTGDGTGLLETYSVAEADSSTVTEKALLNWYQDFVEEQDLDYNVILYTDQEGFGCYQLGSTIYKNVELIQNEDGGYTLGDPSTATLYQVEGDALTAIK